MATLPDDYSFASPPLPAACERPPGTRVLCLAPHPDDEVIGPGGALAMHRARGDAVRVIVATDGRQGDPDGHFAGRDYPALREAESRAGLLALGVDNVDFWRLPDSMVVTDADVDGLAQRVADEFTAFGADMIYAPWEGESNSDHRALCAAVLRGLERAGFGGAAWGYEVWTPMPDPQYMLDITSVEATKRAAIACYPTQLRYVDYDRTIFGLHAHRSLQVHRGEGYCEAYRLLWEAHR